MNIMESFDGTPEEKKTIIGLLTEMGYAVEGGSSDCQPCGGISQLQKDVKELGQEAFMASIPKDTAFRTRASLSRFVKALMLGEADPVGHILVPAEPGEKDKRFHIMLHNIMKADEDDRKLTIRVIHLSRFVDYMLQSRQHAKLVVPEGSSLQLMCELSPNVKAHRAFSAKDLSVLTGSMVLFHSWLRGTDQGFAATLRPPLAPLQPTASVYHFCGPDVGPDLVLKVWHMRAGEVKSEKNLTKLEQYQAMAVLPVERAQLHLESNFRKLHNKGHAIIISEDCSDNMQLPTVQHAGRHVYISQFQEHLWADAGALVNDPQMIDASADLADVQDEADDAVHNGFCIRLHNVSTKKLKFGLKVKVKLPDDRVAHFQLDSHCNSLLRLPEGSSIEVESQSEEFPESKASITLDPNELAKANGGNVYFYSAHDREGWSQEEMALVNKFCPLMILLPLYILVVFILICMVNARKRKRPLCHLVHDVGHPSKGKTIIGSCIVWHFCNFSLGGAETLFLQPKPLTSKDKEKPGFAITSAQSCAVPAASSFALTIWDNPGDNPEDDPDDMQPKGSKLREKTVELNTCKFENRHVYVLWNTRSATNDFTRGYGGALPGAGLFSETAEWDAQAGASVDLEAGKATLPNAWEK